MFLWATALLGLISKAFWYRSIASSSRPFCKRALPRLFKASAKLGSISKAFCNWLIASSGCPFSRRALPRLLYAFA